MSEGQSGVEGTVSEKTNMASMLSMEPVLGYHPSEIRLWSRPRRFSFWLITHTITDILVSVLILFNIIIMIYETDQRALGEDIPPWAKITNSCLLSFYCCELTLRLYVFRSHFFISGYNCLDFAIVGTDLIFESVGDALRHMPNVTMLRILRVLRALRFVRAVRSLVFFRELYMIMNGFFSAMKAIIWATVLLFSVLMLWSVVAVELIHPLVKDMVEKGEFEDCDRCGRAFSNTMNAMLTFTQQIVAGDEWGNTTIPIVEKYPATVVFFAAVLVSVDLGLMNLILSVIVGKAQQAHADDLKFQMQEKEETFVKLKKQLLKMCSQLDEDNSGSLTLDELLSGFDSSNEFHVALQSMDVERDDISSLFDILDEDGSGHVEYDEFVDQLHKMKTQDAHVVLVFIRGHVKDIKNKIELQSARVQTVEDRLELYETRTSEILRLLRERGGGSNEIRSFEPRKFFGHGHGQSPQKPSNGGGFFQSCSAVPQEKYSEYQSLHPVGAQSNARTMEEVRALKDTVAALTKQLSARQEPITWDEVNANLKRSSSGTLSCCSSGGPKDMKVPIAVVEDQAVEQKAGKGKFGKYGRGFGKPGKGKGV